MEPYISPGLATSVRRMFNHAIQHTYTHIPQTVGARNGYGVRTVTEGTPVTGKPCRYLPKPLIREYDTGRATVVTPPVTDDSILVPWDDDLAPGDKITNIRALPEPGETEGRLLLRSLDGSPGEAIVLAEADHAGLGPVTLRRFILRDPQEEEVDPRG